VTQQHRRKALRPRPAAQQRKARIPGRGGEVAARIAQVAGPKRFMGNAQPGAKRGHPCRFRSTARAQTVIDGRR
jgi:hypothetical protein